MGGGNWGVVCFLSLEVEEGKGKRVVSLLLFVGVGVVVRVRGERKGNYAMLCYASDLC